ncbi:MAG: glycosyltransferase family 87 protein [Terracidiphilus sp.]
MIGTTPFEDENRLEQTGLRWPVRLLGPAPGLKELNLLCWGLFLLGLLPTIAGVVYTQFATSGALHADFVYYYGSGKLLNQYPVSQLYDYDLQLKIFNGIYPIHEGKYGPSPYPPFVAWFFSPFARLSFENAYFLWMGISLILYLAGIGAVLAAFFPRQRLKASLFFCFALASRAFLMDTLLNGQLSSVAVFAVGLAVSLERRSKPLYGGLALAILAYKPTLLLVILPMLLLTRKFRMLAGFVAGSAVLLLASTAYAGIGIWSAYLRLLHFFGNTAVLNGHALRLWKEVDLNAFSYAIPGGRSTAGLAILVCLFCCIAAWLALLLWKSAAAGSSAQSLAWAATLTWMLLLNVYVPRYDSILVAISLILTLAALQALGWRKAWGRMILLALVVFAVAWITEEIARSYKVQILTIVLFVLGVAQLILLRRAIRRQPTLLPERL